LLEAKCILAENRFDLVANRKNQLGQENLDAVWFLIVSVPVSAGKKLGRQKKVRVPFFLEL
jgi:hypothetical protein